MPSFRPAHGARSPCPPESSANLEGILRKRGQQPQHGDDEAVEDLSQLLMAADAGDRNAADRVFALVYADLKQLAKPSPCARGFEFSIPRFRKALHPQERPCGFAQGGRFMVMRPRAKRSRSIAPEPSQASTASPRTSQGPLPCSETALGRSPRVSTYWPLWHAGVAIPASNGLTDECMTMSSATSSSTTCFHGIFHPSA